MTPAQLTAACNLLGLGFYSLGRRANVPIHTIKTYAATGRVARMYHAPPGYDPIVTLRTFLEQQGIEFTDGDAPGVRLRSTP